MMGRENIPVDFERAWKDEEYRWNLTPGQLAQLPSNPAGKVELSEEELDQASGGTNGRCGGHYQPSSAAFKAG